MSKAKKTTTKKFDWYGLGKNDALHSAKVRPPKLTTAAAYAAASKDYRSGYGDFYTPYTTTGTDAEKAKRAAAAARAAWFARCKDAGIVRPEGAKHGGARAGAGAPRKGKKTDKAASEVKAPVKASFTLTLEEQALVDAFRRHDVVAMRRIADEVEAANKARRQ